MSRRGFLIPLSKQVLTKKHSFTEFDHWCLAWILEEYTIKFDSSLQEVRRRTSMTSFQLTKTMYFNRIDSQGVVFFVETPNGPIVLDSEVEIGFNAFRFLVYTSEPGLNLGK